MLIEVQNLNKSYRHGFRKKRVLKNLTIQTAGNKIIGIYGQQGSGKTTLLKIIAGITSPDPDYLRFNICDCEDPAAIKKKVGFWPARPFFLTRATPEELVTLSMLAANGNASKESVRQVLAYVGLQQEHGGMFLKDISPGAFQLAGIAQAIVGSPKMLLLDEPLQALNSDERRQVINIIEKWHQDKKTIIFTTSCLQDLDVLGTDAILLKQGELLGWENLESLREKSGYEIRVASDHSRQVYQVANRLDLWGLLEEIRRKEESVITVQSRVTDILKKYYDQ
jgi:ABC-2 type transport system ATP-binding protein